MNEYRIWHQLKSVINDGDLREIAEADYARDIEDHYAALKRIYDSGKLPDILGWEPMEVLSLTSWSDYKTSDRRITCRVLFCALILLAASKSKDSAANMDGQVSKLAIAIDCAKLLGCDWLLGLHEFLEKIIPHLDMESVAEDVLYFHLALYIVSVLLGDFSAAKNAKENLTRVERLLVPLLKEGPHEDIMGYTCFSLRIEIWREYLAMAGDALQQARFCEVLMPYKPIGPEW